MDDQSLREARELIGNISVRAHRCEHDEPVNVACPVCVALALDTAKAAVATIIADHQRVISRTTVGCTCGWFADAEGKEVYERFRKHIISLADQSSLSQIVAQRTAELRRVLQEHFCVCEKPYFGAQVVGRHHCERCGKCVDKAAAAALAGEGRAGS